MPDYSPYLVKKGTVSLPTTTTVGYAYQLDGAAAFSFTISGLATETIGVAVTTDGGATWSSAVKPWDGVTGVLAAAATLANGYYYFPPQMAVNGVRFTKSASADTAAINWLAYF